MELRLVGIQLGHRRTQSERPLHLHRPHSGGPVPVLRRHPRNPHQHKRLLARVKVHGLKAIRRDLLLQEPH